MPTQTTDLFLLEDLEDEGRTRELAEGDLKALNAVADWIKTFVVKPHEDLGRPGPVCPFVPASLERKTLWLAPVRIGDGGAPHAVELIDRYKSQFLAVEPTAGEGLDYKVIVVIFTDLSTESAQGIFQDALQELAVSAYVENGIVFGPFFKGNDGTAIYNANFRPFQSPSPFMFVRQGVIGDWKFFLDDPDWTSRWAHRFGESAVQALAEELRRLPWRARRD